MWNTTFNGNDFVGLGTVNFRREQGIGVVFGNSVTKDDGLECAFISVNNGDDDGTLCLDYDTAILS